MLWNVQGHFVTIDIHNDYLLLTTPFTGLMVELVHTLTLTTHFLECCLTREGNTLFGNQLITEGTSMRMVI